MELLVRKYASCKVCSVISFLHAAGHTNMEIHEELKRVNDAACVMLTMVGRCVAQFDAGRTEVHDLRQHRQPSDVMMKWLS